MKIFILIIYAFFLACMCCVGQKKLIDPLRPSISALWINEITKKKFDISNVDPFAEAYGFFWFSTTKEVNGKKYECIYASGNGGNLLFVVPGEHLVVSLISSAYGQGYGQYRSHNIFTYILKSIE